MAGTGMFRLKKERIKWENRRHGAMVCCTVSLGEKEVKLHLDHPDGRITKAKEGKAGRFRLDVS